MLRIAFSEILSVISGCQMMWRSPIELSSLGEKERLNSSWTHMPRHSHDMTNGPWCVYVHVDDRRRPSIDACAVLGVSVSHHTTLHNNVSLEGTEKLAWTRPPPFTWYLLQSAFFFFLSFFLSFFGSFFPDTFLCCVFCFRMLSLWSPFPPCFPTNIFPPSPLSFYVNSNFANYFSRFNAQLQNNLASPEDNQWYLFYKVFHNLSSQKLFEMTRKDKKSWMAHR